MLRMYCGILEEYLRSLWKISSVYLNDFIADLLKLPRGSFNNVLRDLIQLASGSLRDRSRVSQVCDTDLAMIS